MKRILILVSKAPKDKEKSMNWGALKASINKNIGKEFDTTISALNELSFIFGAKKSSTIYTADGHDLADFDLVVFRTVGQNLELAIATANYLRFKKVKFVDPYIPSIGTGKLACTSLRWRNHLPNPSTVYAPSNFLDKAIELSKVSYPLILKSDTGKKGRDNYLISDSNELHSVLKNNSDTRFVVQKFINSNGDYRVLVMEGKITAVIKRTPVGGSHLSNTSQGGSAKLVSPKVFDAHVTQQILSSVKAEKLTFAGVDIIYDKKTKKHYFLEVNRAPQIGTGAFSSKKLKDYSNTLKELVKNNERPKKRVGRLAVVELPEYSSKKIPAKVDTGAYSSSIHCEKIEKVVLNDGTKVLKFKPINKKSKTVETTEFYRRGVRSSNGVLQKRYFIKTKIKIGDNSYIADFSLNNRSSLKWPVLIGRKFLSEHSIVVDVSMPKSSRELLKGIK